MEITAAPWRSQDSQGCLAPFQGARRDHSVPVVFAALRPPATLSPPFGLHADEIGSCVSLRKITPCQRQLRSVLNPEKVLRILFTRENPRVKAEATTAVLWQFDDPIAHGSL